MHWTDPSLEEKARGLAKAYGLTPAADAAPAAGSLILELTPKRLQLRLTGPHAPGAVYVDFGKFGYRRRQGSLKKEAIARACGLKGDRTLEVLDATAGLGKDAFILAALGARVTLVERSPVITALLDDGLQRAAELADLAAVAARMSLCCTDSTTLLRQQSPHAGPMSYISTPCIRKAEREPR
ncbi:class I SAM-dependent methyltransferase [Alkalilimnicola ehrlichii]|uniref:class I SAM-dependent methyltransferase n=1 Tax=Alkalilimnicola ehrlichii TaxID=351052 RepID=UPI0015F28B18|nr:class I SAM-dependent methyltransferase [Alkalilimnicola ehrlichii]